MILNSEEGLSAFFVGDTLPVVATTLVIVGLCISALISIVIPEDGSVRNTRLFDAFGAVALCCFGAAIVGLFIRAMLI